MYNFVAFVYENAPFTERFLHGTKLWLDITDSQDVDVLQILVLREF